MASQTSQSDHVSPWIKSALLLMYSGIVALNCFYTVSDLMAGASPLYAVTYASSACLAAYSYDLMRHHLRLCETADPVDELASAAKIDRELRLHFKAVIFIALSAAVFVAARISAVVS